MNTVTKLGFAAIAAFAVNTLEAQTPVVSRGTVMLEGKEQKVVFSRMKNGFSSRDFIKVDNKTYGITSSNSNGKFDASYEVKSGSKITESENLFLFTEESFEDISKDMAEIVSEYGFKNEKEIDLEACKSANAFLMIANNVKDEIVANCLILK